MTSLQEAISALESLESCSRGHEFAHASLFPFLVHLSAFVNNISKCNDQIPPLKPKEGSPKAPVSALESLFCVRDTRRFRSGSSDAAALLCQAIAESRGASTIVLIRMGETLIQGTEGSCLLTMDSVPKPGDTLRLVQFETKPNTNALSRPVIDAKIIQIEICSSKDETNVSEEQSKKHKKNPNKSEHNSRRVVRDAEARKAMPGYSCTQCECWYKAVGHEPGMCNDTSRHRMECSPPRTPPGFWDIGFGN